MQQTPPSSLTGLEYVLISIVTVLAGGIGSLLTWLVNRRKVKPEITVIEASAEKVRAEARRLDSDTIGAAYARLDELWEIAENQRIQIRQLGMDSDKKTIEVELLEDELKWLKGVINAADIKLSDYDYLRRKK